LYLQVVGYSDWNIGGPIVAALLATSLCINFALGAAYAGAKKSLSEAQAHLERKIDSAALPMTPRNAARILGSSSEIHVREEGFDISSLESRTPAIFASRQTSH